YRHIGHPHPYLALTFTATTATTICSLSLHDALPISGTLSLGHYIGSYGSLPAVHRTVTYRNSGTADATLNLAVSATSGTGATESDRKSTRLNSSHLGISYAVFCLKKKTKNTTSTHSP